MSQTQLPTKQMQERSIQTIRKQMQDQQLAFQKLQQLPQVQQMMQQNPQQVQQVQQQAQAALQQAQASGQEAIKKISEKPTLDQVMKFLKDNRVNPAFWTSRPIRLSSRTSRPTSSRGQNSSACWER
jgi:hypothetical protein